MLEYPVLTPENVRFHYTLAGPGSRFAAWFLDVLLVGAFLFVLSLAFALAAAIFGEWAQAGLVLASATVVMAYWMLSEALLDGRTIGKRTLGLRVVGERGLRLTLGQVVLRNLLRPVDMLPALGAVGGVAMLLHPEHRRLGDLAAGTLVIRERRVPPPDAIRGPQRERDARRGAAELELPRRALRAVSAEQREFLLDLCLRRDALDDAVRLRLFEQVASHYRSSLDLPQEVGVSDEKLVLELTAALSEGAGKRS